MSDESRRNTSVEDLLADVEAYIEDWFQAKLPFTFRGGLRWTPPTDVYETAEEYHVTMAVPGLRPDDVGVRFEDDTLRVRGVRHEACTDRRRYHKMEIPVGPFERKVRLPRPIRVDDIRVRYENGLLRIVLPKRGSGSFDVAID